MPEQLPSDQRDLATPSYLDPSPDCVCGHEEADHQDFGDPDGEEWMCIGLGITNPAIACKCETYRPKDDYYYEELRQEAMLAKWEDR